MKAAIVGLGWQGKRHYEALRELGVELSCVVDLQPQAVAERISGFPAERVFDDPAVLKKYRPDVAIIATNAAARLDNVRHCLDAGVKKIFCEKPMATRLEDALEIVRLAREAGCTLAVNHLRRWNQNYLRLKKLLQDDAIGKVEHLYAQTGSVGLGNEGTHVVDKMRMVTGADVQWVIGFTDKTGTPNVRGAQYKDPAGWGMMLFSDGTRAFLDTSEDTGVPPVFEIVGTYGRIIIEELNNHWTVLTRKAEDRQIPLTRLPTPLWPEPFENTLPWDVTEFTKLGLKELIFTDAVSCTGEDGAKALEAALAFHVSDQLGGQKVQLPLDREYHALEVPWA